MLKSKVFVKANFDTERTGASQAGRPEMEMDQHITGPTEIMQVSCERRIQSGYNQEKNGQSPEQFFLDEFADI
jgi:hypothetical protein